MISDRYVVTASHCVNGKSIPPTWALTGVRLGDWNIATERDCDNSFVGEPICSDPPVDVAIAEKIPHESYNPQSKDQHNDIALLRLARSVQFTAYIKPICLPVASHLRSKNFVGQSLDVAGWGKTEVSNKSDLKLKVQIKGVPKSECSAVYARENINIINSQICAGGVKGEDSCSGDSGGPLMTEDVIYDPSQPYWYLAGVVYVLKMIFNYSGTND